MDIDLIVRDIVSEIDRKITVKTASPIVDGKQSITFESPKYLRLFRKLDGKPIKTTDGVTFEIETDQAYTRREVFMLPNIHYFVGTRRQLNEEWNIVSKNDRDKLPGIWLINPVREVNDFSRNIRTANIGLFVMCELKTLNWTEEIRQQNIAPMLSICRLIYNAINENPKFLQLNEYETRDFVKFGVEDKNGVIKNVLDSSISAVEMRFELEILNCCKNG